MTLTKIKPVVIITVAVITAILIILIFGILATKEKTPKQNQTNTTQNQSKKSIKLPQAKNFDDELVKLKSSLPLQGPNYSVKFNGSLNIILAEVKANSAQEYLDTKTKIEEYIKSEEVDNICALNIFWVVKASPEVRNAIDVNDTLTTGCPVVPPKN